MATQRLTLQHPQRQPTVPFSGDNEVSVLESGGCARISCGEEQGVNGCGWGGEGLISAIARPSERYSRCLASKIEVVEVELENALRRV